MPLVGPPERVGLHELVLLEVGPGPPALVVRQRVAVLLEQGVDPRDPAVPGVLQVLQREAAVLLVGFLALQRILGPHPLGVDELGLPRLDVPVQVGDELVLVVAHARPEELHPHLRLLGVLEIRLGDQHVSHGQHPKPTQLFGGVEHHGGEARRHLGVQADLDPRLDLVLALHQQVQQLLRVDRGLAVVGHEADEDRVPLVHDLGEGGGPGGHQHLPHPVLEPLQGVVVHPQERLGRALLGALVLQVPHAVLRHELLVEAPDLGQDADLEAGHGEQQVGVVLRVYGHEALVPLDAGDGARQAVLDVPEHPTA
mmetsp:Transcript_139393/g.242389  ORF Transcript_139393/g.242389 Transcript_139393/m.242389 type:complete len:312 (+) Transcript_139393:3827-4762(+)